MIKIEKKALNKIDKVNEYTGFEVLNVKNKNKIKLKRQNICQIDWYVLQGKITNALLSKKNIWTENDLYRFYLTYSFGLKYEYTFSSYELFRNQYLYNDLSLKDGMNFLFININSWSKVQTDTVVIPLNRYNYQILPYGLLKYFIYENWVVKNDIYKKNLIKVWKFNQINNLNNNIFWLTKKANKIFTYNKLKNIHLYNFWLKVEKLTDELWYKKSNWSKMFITKYRTSVGYNIFIFYNWYKKEYSLNRFRYNIKRRRKRLTKRFIAGISKIFKYTKKNKNILIKYSRKDFIDNKKIWHNLQIENYRIIKYDKNNVYLKKYPFYNILYKKKKNIIDFFFFNVFIKCIKHKYPQRKKIKWSVNKVNLLKKAYLLNNIYKFNYNIVYMNIFNIMVTRIKLINLLKYKNLLNILYMSLFYQFWMTYLKNRK